MTKERKESARMFEMLAVLHLHASISGEISAPSSAVEPTLSTLQAMGAEDWDRFLRFAELQRVQARTLLILARWAAAGAIQPCISDFSDRAEAEQQRIAKAMSGLEPVRTALERTAHPPIVIKTLDHWPDIGSDLDLFTSASERDTVRIMRDELYAETQPQSWGDRLAQKWNFRIPGLAPLVEIHVGRLGQTGEQDALCDFLEETSVLREAGPLRFRVPSAEAQVMLSTLQRMYRHFYIRLTDLVNLTRLVRAKHLDFELLRASANRWSIWPGVATLLKITSDYNRRVGAGPLPLPAFVKQDASFGAEVTYVGEQFLRMPFIPQGSQLYLQQLIGTGAARHFRAAARLSLFPALAAAAFVNLRITGNDKGIW